MLIQVETGKPCRRFLFVRFRFTSWGMCFLTISLMSALIWISKLCELRKISWKPENFQRINQIQAAKGCFWPTNTGNFTLKLLKDVLEAELRPTPGRSIFFHETSCTQNGTIHLNARQACSIESAAKWNPGRDVFVIFTATVGFPVGIRPSIIRALESYPNIHFRNVNLANYAAETPMADWLKTDQLFESKYLISHTSDFLRYTSMLRFGGIYLDLDVVVQQSFDLMPANFAAAESMNFVAVGAIGFEANGIGHEVAALCAREFADHFKVRDWGFNGPGVATRILQRICQVNRTIDMKPDKCWQFNVLPKEAFYAIDSSDWQMFFDPNVTDETLLRTNRSIIVHVWNRKSAERFIRKGTAKTAYEIIASKNCPEVYQASGIEF